jgi:hypothetical protein
VEPPFSPRQSFTPIFLSTVWGTHPGHQDLAAAPGEWVPAPLRGRWFLFLAALTPPGRCRSYSGPLAPFTFCSASSCPVVPRCPLLPPAPDCDLPRARPAFCLHPSVTVANPSSSQKLGQVPHVVRSGFESPSVPSWPCDLGQPRPSEPHRGSEDAACVYLQDLCPCGGSQVTPEFSFQSMQRLNYPFPTGQPHPAPVGWA